MNKENLIPYVVQLIILFISYKLGRYQMKNKYILDKLEERYNKAYVPYITELYFMEWIHLNSWHYNHNYDYYVIYIRHLTENLQYFEYTVVKKYYSFYKLFCETYYTSWKRQSRTDDIKGHLLVAFERMNIAILKEALEISNELKLPPLAKFLLEKHRSNW